MYGAATRMVYISVLDDTFVDLWSLPVGLHL